MDNTVMISDEEVVFLTMAIEYYLEINESKNEEFYVRAKGVLKTFLVEELVPIQLYL